MPTHFSKKFSIYEINTMLNILLDIVFRSKKSVGMAIMVNEMSENNLDNCEISFCHRLGTMFCKLINVLSLNI